MAIAPTGAIYKSLVFDGESSRDFGVYITGEAVYNAPEREVEMITIPGRSGQLALDKNRFENIEVTYPAGIFAGTETDFADAVSDFRNFLCSRKGYVRLTDEYHPNEYRLAVYKSGLEVKAEQLKAGQFDIIFDCKPQRFLISGETPVTIQNGATLVNPTLFGSKPMLEVSGYGTIGINGNSLTINNVPLGDVAITEEDTVVDAPATYSFEFDTSLMSQGDTITVPRITFEMDFEIKPNYSNVKTVIERTDYPPTNAAAFTTASGDVQKLIINPGTFTYGTAGYYEGSAEFDTSWTGGQGEGFQKSIDVTYDGGNTISVWCDRSYASCFNLIATKWIIPSLYTYSSASALTDPVYVDLDIGAVYGYRSNELISLNNAAVLPAKLPELTPGANEITYDGTVTSLKVVPRWFKI